MLEDLFKYIQFVDYYNVDCLVPSLRDEKIILYHAYIICIILYYTWCSWGFFYFHFLLEMFLFTQVTFSSMWDGDKVSQLTRISLFNQSVEHGSTGIKYWQCWLMQNPITA